MANERAERTRAQLISKEHGGSLSNKIEASVTDIVQRSKASESSINKLSQFDGIFIDSMRLGRLGML